MQLMFGSTFEEIEERIERVELDRLRDLGDASPRQAGSGAETSTIRSQPDPVDRRLEVGLADLDSRTQASWSCPVISASSSTGAHGGNSDDNDEFQAA